MNTAKIVTLVVITHQGIVDVQPFVVGASGDAATILTAQGEAQEKSNAYGEANFLQWRKMGATVFSAQTRKARFEIWLANALVI